MVLPFVRQALIIAAAIFAVAAATCPNGTRPMENGPPNICVPGPDGCPPGMVLGRKMIFPGWYVDQCSKCPPGQTTYSYSARRCRHIGYPCPTHSIETDQGDCVRCDPDQFFDLKTQRCQSCPTGSGSVAGHSLWCAPCSELIKKGVKHSRCTRGSVLVAQGHNCPSGSMLSYRDSAGVALCWLCPRGTFNSGANQRRCRNCPALSVSIAGSSSCTQCPRDMIPNSVKSECLGRESGCPRGQQKVEMFGRTFCRSPSCSNGDNSYPAATKRKCGPCNESPLRSEYLGEDGKCQICPADSLSDGLRCIKCPPGLVRTADGRCACRGYLALDRGVDENGKCVRCPKGSYGVPGPNGEHVCTKCQAGTYFSDSAYRYNTLGCFVEPRCKKSYNLCSACRRGTVSTVPGSLTCHACPAGTLAYGSECARKGEPSSPVPYTDPFGKEYQA